MSKVRKAGRAAGIAITIRNPLVCEKVRQAQDASIGRTLTETAENLVLAGAEACGLGIRPAAIAGNHPSGMGPTVASAG